MYRVRILLLTTWLVWSLSMLPARAQNPPTASPGSASHPSAQKPTASDIAAAKAAGKVWINLDTGIYHKAGRWYGKTKNGRFMTADEAGKAGYKPAKRD
jgi:hypothetical protein